LTDVNRWSEWRAVVPLFALGRYSRQVDQLPTFPFLDATDQIIQMYALLDDHDRAGALVIQATVERVFEPCVRSLAKRIGKRIVGLDRVVDYGDVPTASRERPSDRRRQTSALLGRFQVRDCFAIQSRTEDLLVPPGQHD